MVVEHTFETVDGVKLRIHPVSQLLLQRIRQAVRQEFEERGEPLAVPTYTATTVTGEMETHPHDETTLETDEDRAAWTAYQDANARLQAAMIDRVTRTMLRRGVELPTVPPGWLEEMRALGIDLPDDPFELQVEYLVMELLPTTADTRGLIGRITALSLSGLQPEAVKAVEALFRGNVEGPAAPGTADRTE